MLKLLYSILPEWQSSRLQRRFAYISGGLLTVVSLVFLLVLAGVYRDRVLDARTQAAQQVNSLLEASLINAMLKRDIDGLEQILADLVAQPGVHDARILNPEGQIRFGAGFGDVLPDPAVGAALESGTAQHGLRRTADGRLVLRAVEPVANQLRCAGCHGTQAETPVNGLLVVDYPMDGLHAELLRGVILLGALGLAVMLAVQTGLWISLRRLVLDRAVALDRTAQAFAAGDLSARVEGGPEDEISRLGSSFNDMARRLETTLTELRGQKAFLQSLVDSIPDGVRVIGPDFRTLLVNRAFRDQQGLGVAPVEGQPCFALSHGRDTPCTPTMVCCPVAQLSDDTPRIRCHHTHIGGGSTRLRVEVQATRVEMLIDGVLQPCVIESIRDLETASSISQEQRLSELGMLAAGLAHEVFNPLASVGLILDRLEHQPLDDGARDLLEVARTEIATCRHVTQSLLRLAAPGQTPPTVPEPVAMDQVLRDTARLLGFEAEQRGVVLDVQVDGQPILAGRDSDLRMLVFNLTQNAIHAMPDGGQVQLRCATDGDRVRIEVEDHGVGIAPDDRERVLMPFWTRRADGTTGRGLGLPICASIVSGMGGVLDFDSVPGKGTVFRVDLPQRQGGPDV